MCLRHVSPPCSKQLCQSSILLQCSVAASKSRVTTGFDAALIQVAMALSKKIALLAIGHNFEWVSDH